MKSADIQHISANLSAPASAQQTDEVQACIPEPCSEPDNIYHEPEMRFRYADTHQDISSSNAVTQLHSHSFYEILYCRNTCGAEYLVESQRYRLEQGDIVMIPPGVSHRPLLPPDMTEPFMRDILWLTPEFIDTVARLFPGQVENANNKTNLFHTAGTKWESIGDIFRKGVKESERQMPGWEAAVIGNTVTLLTTLKRALLDCTTMPLSAETPELLDQVMAYVEDHLAEKITLSEIARHFFVSEATISLTFRKKMGTSFHRCLNQRRLIAAKTLIAEGMLLETVGEQVGFADYSTFYRAFKQEYGISPRQYRKMQEATDRL